MDNQQFFKELDTSFIDYHGDSDIGFLWHTEAKSINKLLLLFF